MEHSGARREKAENTAGKTAVITGATSGIGLAALKELAGLGFRVIGVGRDPKRCAEAEASIRSEVPGARVDYLVADLASQRQVRDLAAAIRRLLATENGGCLDLLVNNAGTVSSWYVTTEDGYEMQFAVNHLAPFLLTRELLPLLKKAGSARVITTSSGSHYNTRINWRDVMYRRGYNCLLAYKQSKLANVLFTSEFNRRQGPGSGVRAYAVDPGLVNTEIGEKGTSGFVCWFWRIRRKRGVAPEIAARTIVHLAATPELEDPEAVYWKDCRPKRPSGYSQRKDAGRRLWELSERLTGTGIGAGG
ncbi:MAG: SDR family NAD(P)-dependent oxidoreductase [Clostridia bacterium]|nr:SDR family NAD(P)-dependent oxidoreductase [Clostridia bacterium]